MSMPGRRADAARNSGGALDQLARDRFGVARELPFGGHISPCALQKRRKVLQRRKRSARSQSRWDSYACSFALMACSELETVLPKGFCIGELIPRN